MLDFVVDPPTGLEGLCLWGRGEVVQISLEEPESLYRLFLVTSSELSLCATRYTEVYMHIYDTGHTIHEQRKRRGNKPATLR